MKIRLNNVGIVSDSTMLLNGLTIITGKNNSGKTTVGKAVYSLLDAVSNLNSRANNDRERYIIDQLDDLVETIEFLRFYVHAQELSSSEELKDFALSFPALYSLLSDEYKHDGPSNKLEDFARLIKQELSKIKVEELYEIRPIQLFISHKSKTMMNRHDILRVIAEKIDAANTILIDLLSALEKDPQLIEYARESINQTLNVEFSGQIQPASHSVANSKIEIYDNDVCCYNVNIENNRVVNNGEPVFYTTPYKKVFFIDNPFIFDDSSIYRRYLRYHTGIGSESLLNPSNIISHNNKLKFILKADGSTSVFEQTIINDSLDRIKREFDSIVPGAFEFSPSGDYYITNGTKLKISNLATGSKMFSIIKILLEKGHLGKSTMLILDEPEAHLHPSWQNKFAEMIVLLVKELGVNIVLTTHSSNFVLALDAYMRKHKVQEITNFYRTEFDENGMVDYVCVDDNIEDIYQDFLQYLSEVKMLRNKYLKNCGE